MQTVCYVLNLTRGYRTIVSAEDFDRASQFTWYAQSAGTQIYAARREFHDSPIILLHRFLLEAKAKELVDHRDGNGLNNCRKNLRLATHSQNHGNQTKQRGFYTSKYKGVCWSSVNQTNPWLAYISAGKRRYLGYHPTEEQAAKAYDRAAKNLFGEFALLNFGGRQ